MAIWLTTVNLIASTDKISSKGYLLHQFQNHIEKENLLSASALINVLTNPIIATYCTNY